MAGHGFAAGGLVPAPYERNSCAARVTAGASLGAAVGAAVGAVYGTYEAFRYRVPGLYKLRYIGQNTVGSAVLFGLFLGTGSLLQCGRNTY